MRNICIHIGLNLTYIKMKNIWIRIDIEEAYSEIEKSISKYNVIGMENEINDTLWFKGDIQQEIATYLRSF